MKTTEMLEKIVKAIDSKKGENITAIKVENVTIIADYFVITNGTSSTQVKALADEVEYKLKQDGVMPLRIEGHRSNNWVLIDYGTIVVHVFLGETREFYSLEHLWTDGEKVDVSALLS